MCKTAAQYIRACRRKLRKTVYFLYSKFQKRHNSFNNWRDDTQTWSVVHQIKVTFKLSAQYVKACRRKVRKTGGRRPGRGVGRAESRTDGDSDGHHHTILRPVRRRAYKSKRSDSVLWQKPLHPHKKSQNQRDNTNTPPKTIVDRRRTVKTVRRWRGKPSLRRYLNLWHSDWYPSVVLVALARTKLCI